MKRTTSPSMTEVFQEESDLQNTLPETFKIRKSPEKKIVRKRARERKEGKKRVLSTYLEDDSFGP
jgi:hypothetical protein